MVVEATFVNPYAASTHSWDYGLFVRYDWQDDVGSFLGFIVTSDHLWEVKSGTGSSSSRLDSGTIGNFDLSTGGRNHLMVVTIGVRGWFFVNGEHIASVDLSSVAGPGDIAVITGAYTGHEVAGAVTRYEGFKGYALRKQYGPAEGVLEKEPGRIGTHWSGVRTRDLVAEAEFINPHNSQDWDYGFVIRNPEFGRLEVISVTNDERWYHDSSKVGDDAYTDVTSGYLRNSGVNLSSNRNRLLLIAVEGSGWLFLGDQVVTKLDLRHNDDMGSVSAMGGFFDKIRGKIEFLNFNVWAP